MALKDGDATANEMGEKYGRDNVSFLRVDVASHTNFEEAFFRCKEVFGGLDILVNNAGINADSRWETQIDCTLVVRPHFHILSRMSL